MYGTAWDRERLPYRPTPDALASAQCLAQHYGRKTKRTIQIVLEPGSDGDTALPAACARLAAHNARLYIDGLEEKA